MPWGEGEEFDHADSEDRESARDSSRGLDGPVAEQICSRALAAKPVRATISRFCCLGEMAELFRSFAAGIVGNASLPPLPESPSPATRRACVSEGERVVVVVAGELLDWVLGPGGAGEGVGLGDVEHGWSSEWAPWPIAAGDIIWQ